MTWWSRSVWVCVKMIIPNWWYRFWPQVDSQLCSSKRSPRFQVLTTHWPDFSHVKFAGYICLFVNNLLITANNSYSCIFRRYHFSPNAKLNRRELPTFQRHRTVLFTWPLPEAVWRQHSAIENTNSPIAEYGSWWEAPEQNLDPITAMHLICSKYPVELE